MDTASQPLSELIAALGADSVIAEPASMEAYRRDYCTAGVPGMPLAVARPRTAEGVQVAVRWAARHQVPIVPRGAGSGLSGGSNAIDGCLTISLDRLSEIEIDPATRTASVGAGAMNIDVKKAAAQHGLSYPPDPSSYEICSIGGNVATNAGGLCCVKYGVTTDYVLGLDVVLADGRLISLGGPRVKDVAGLPLLKLFTGSEGTLGIFTRVLLRLVPSLPPPATLVATFATPRAAAEGVVAACQLVRPSLLELMDRASINAVEDFKTMGLNRGAGALVMAQCDAVGEARLHEVSLVEAAFTKAGAAEVFVTEDPEEGELFTAARRMVLPAVETRGAVLLEDVGTAITQLPDMVEGVAEIAAEFGLLIPTVAHAGDGNTHPIIVFDPTDRAETDRAHAAFEAIMRLSINLGGTITGEHGVGRLKRAVLPEMLGEDVMSVNRAIKQALDPTGILNPGALL